MTATIIDGKETAKENANNWQRSRRAESTRRSAWIGGHFNRRRSRFCFICDRQEKAAETMGMKFKLDRFDSSLTEAEL